MTYEEAIAAAKGGKNVAREHWCDVYLRRARTNEPVSAESDLVLDHGDRLEVWNGPDTDPEIDDVGATDWHEVDDDGSRV